MHFLLFCTLSTAMLVLGAWLYMQPLLPKLDTLDKYMLEIPLHVYSSEGHLIGEFGEKRRIPISYEEAPQDLINAFLAAEDDRFFSHAGVDLAGIARAFIELVLSGSIQSGGSTITMQVARNYLLTSDRTLVRKIKEILLAFKIEQRFSKEKILELYLNKIFLGKRAYGAQAAARIYYGKNLPDLDLAQYAMIAGLPKAPSAYNPLVNPKRALDRRNWILQRLYNLDKISKERYQQARAKPISATQHDTAIGLDAQHAAEWTRQIVIDKMYGLAAYSRGYKVFTTIRSDWQRQARRSVAEGIFEYDWRHGWRGIKNRLFIEASTMSLSVDGKEVELLSSSDGDFPDILVSYEEIQSDEYARINVGTDTNSYLTSLPRNHSPDKEGGYGDLPSARLLSQSDHFNAWQKQLKALPRYDNLVPAGVLAIDWRRVQVVLADGSKHYLKWKHGISSAKRFITKDQVGLGPVSAFDLMGVGDVIYVRRYKGEYHLRQVPEVRAALVSVNPNNGAVHSLVSGFDFESDKFNIVTQGQRQPGSGIKPFIYVKALEEGFTAASMFNDAPLAFEDEALEDVWRPSNAGDVFRGPTRVRVALYRSINLVSIRILRKIGINSAVASLRRFGFNMRGARRDLSLVLGSQSVRPLDMARAYSVFANGGYLIEPYIIERIEDANGTIIYQANPKQIPALECPLDSNEACEQFQILQYGLPAENEDSSNIAKRVVDERVNYIMDDMLRDVVRRGTARAARALGRDDIAGKTGTTNGPTDAWFAGYHSKATTVVWVGFADNRSMGQREYGGSTALPIWVNFMRTVLQGEPTRQLSQPDGISVVRIDPVTGELATSTQDDDDLEVFRNEYIPKRKWNTTTQVEVDEDATFTDEDQTDARSSVDELF